ncbi:serine/threonine-protein kinase, partial [Arthrobacter sp. JCM 19049]
MAEVIAGRFELIEHIAQGGSGSVWLARDLQCRRRCAAKVMRQSYSGELLRFVREQGVKFDHPHLLTPYGWAAVDDRVVIASQLMRGGNLHTALQDYGAMSPELTAEVLAQLLEALGHVHAAGWIHRDVKPANVLLELTGTGVPRVRLTDFGIAAHMDQPRLT